MSEHFTGLPGGHILFSQEMLFTLQGLLEKEGDDLAELLYKLLEASMFVLPWPVQV
jgi:hypothetical protein